MHTQSADVSIIGLGKLGASMLAGMASRGIKVIGVDVSPQAVEAINQGRGPVDETNLDATISAHADKVRATLDYEDAVHNTSISFVIVPTPSDEHGAFSLRYAAKCFASIGKALRTKSDYHVVVLTSTVLPGATRHGLLPVLEKESGKKCGTDFGLCYNPEFIALGSVIRDFLNPDFYLLGQFDERSGDALEAVHRRVSANNAPVKRMNLENAEIAKIAVNSFVTLKISYANMLAGLCEKIPGADIDVVSDAIGADSRIGKKYLKGGLAFGGPCFPRDNVALAFIGKHLGVDTSILQVNDAFNRKHSATLLENLSGYIPATGKAAVLGLAYKPFSHVIEESASIVLCKTLEAKGYQVTAYDPLANETAKRALGPDFAIADSMENCVADADIVFIATADPQFAHLEARHLKSSGAYVIDFWRFLDGSFKGKDGVTHISGGRCLDPMAAEQTLTQLWKM